MIDLGEVGGDRRGAEKPFETALGEAGRHRLAVDEGNAVFLGDRADGQRDAGLIGAGERDHLLFGDQAQRLVLAGGGAALVVGEHHLDLGAAEAGEACALGQREIPSSGWSLLMMSTATSIAALACTPALAALPLKRKDRADLDGLSAPTRRPPAQATSRQPKAARRYASISCDRLRKVPPVARLLRPCVARPGSPALSLLFGIPALHARLAGASYDAVPQPTQAHQLVEDTAPVVACRDGQSALTAT